MFREDLDPQFLNWFKEGKKFGSEHVLMEDTDSELEESEVEDSSDTEDVSNGGYTLDLSLGADFLKKRISNGTYVAEKRISNGTYVAATEKYPNANCDSSDVIERSEFSPSREMMRTRWKANGDESSLDFSVESYSCRITYREDARVNAEKTNYSCAASAQSFDGCNQEFKEDADLILGSRTCGSPCSIVSDCSSIQAELESHANAGSNSSNQQSRSTSIGIEAFTYCGSLPVRVPKFYASVQGPWHAFIAYDACVRLCLHSWARGCMEATTFLEGECALLRNAFGLDQILLQSEEELLTKPSLELTSEGAARKPKRTTARVKVQVHRVMMSPYVPCGSSFSSKVIFKSLRHRMSKLRSTMVSELGTFPKAHTLRHLPTNTSFSHFHLACMHTSSQYLKQLYGILKVGFKTLRNSSSYETVQETYCCHLRLKSSSAGERVTMQPRSGETHTLFSDSQGDDLIIEVYDSKGIFHGLAVVPLASIADIPGDKLHWWSIYHEPDHELVGRIQFSLKYTIRIDENNSKYGSVAETVVYDIVLEVAMKAQQVRQRQLLLHGEWKWLLDEFASYFGLSDSYTKLRYLSYIMDVATPTADCLTLVHDLLLPVIIKSQNENNLSHQENRIIGEIKEQVEQILSMVFRNYKSLDESLPSGISEVLRPATGSLAPALLPALKLYTLLQDIRSPEAQLKLFNYFQAAVRKRSTWLLVEADEFVASNSGVSSADAAAFAAAYQKMKTLCLSVRNEIFTDIEIHHQHILPSFIVLPNISASIYSPELCKRLSAFLVACPPSAILPPVADLVIATADFQKDLDSWNICPIKGGVDAKELFHLYIISWIQDKHFSLLESCKLDKVKWLGIQTQYLTTPFVDDMYDQMKDTLREYSFFICRWPAYTPVLENAIADIEKAVFEALEKQYANVLTPLKDRMIPKKFGLKCIRKLSRRNSTGCYIVPDELGIALNSTRRLLDVLWPKIEMQLKSWGSCIPDADSNTVGGRLSEVTVDLRAKFRNYLQALAQELAWNITTKLKKVIQDSTDFVQSDVQIQMELLKEQLCQTIDHLHAVFDVHVFVPVCRGYWDQIGQDLLNFLKNQKENWLCCEAAGVTVTVLDETFASKMQQLLGNALQEEDLEPPKSIVEVHSMFCRDGMSHELSTCS